MLGIKRGHALKTYVADYVVFDLETTGISTERDEVIEISGVKARQGTVVEEFNTLVNPGRPIPYGASQVNGITDEMVAEAPPFSQALERFLDFVGDAVLVGHNISTFDMRFLYRDSQRFYGKIPDNDFIDTLVIARQCLPGLRHHRLVDLAGYYGIPIRGAHRALSDCHMNQQVFERLAEEMKKILQESDRTLAEGRFCPKCGKPMRLRSGRYGEFWGCSGYPRCRYTENAR